MSNEQSIALLGEIFGSEMMEVLSAKLQATKADNDRKEVTFKREGVQIIIPEGMSYAEAAKWVSRKQQEDEQEVAVSETIHGYPLDAALALAKAMSKIYGWTSMTPTPGFFGDRPPHMISVQVAVNETVSVPWGRFKIPGLEGHIESGITMEDGAFAFQLEGRVRQKCLVDIKRLAAMAREILVTDSIYKGKAISVDFPDEDDADDFSPVDHAPKFMDLSRVRKEELIFPRETQDLVTSSLFTPIRHTQACRDAQIPRKRGILLEGPYGVGKTLTANVVAKLCEENGWTFIYIHDLGSLPKAVRFARRYEPAVIFAEDIDRAVGQDRNDVANDILNTIDGVDSKDRELIVVLTTNNVEKIHPAMLRPGRLDTVVSVRPPDAPSVEALIRLYCRGLLEDNVSLGAVGVKLAGQIPAVIREVVERAKLDAITRLEGTGTLLLAESDLDKAATGMLAHLALVKPKDAPPSQVELAAHVIGARIGEAIGKSSFGKNGHSKAELVGIELS